MNSVNHVGVPHASIATIIEMKKCPESVKVKGVYVVDKEVDRRCVLATISI